MKLYKGIVSIISFLCITFILFLGPLFTQSNFIIPHALADITCVDKPSDPTNISLIVNDVKTKYGIILAGSALTTEDALDVFNSMCLIWNSPTYRANLNSISYPIPVTFISKSGCLEFTTYNPLTVTLCEGRTSIVNKYVLIHELTHVLQSGTNGHNAFFTDWTNNVWSTEKNHKLPTGPCYYEDKGDGGECEADAVAEFVYYQTYRNSWSQGPAGPNTFNDQQAGFNYPRDFPLEYNFVKKNFFGGLEFSGSGQTTGNQGSNVDVQFNYPVLAPNTYNYIKSRLFDGVDMFISNSGTNPINGVNNSDIASYAKDLSDMIRPICPRGNTNPQWGFVGSSNAACLDNISPSFDTNFSTTSKNRDSMVTELKTSAANDIVLQCVGFVVAVSIGIGNPLPATGHNAQDYNTNFPGYSWTPNTPGATMQAGDIVVWKRSSGNGHIAVVYAVHNTSFEVYEANGGTGSVGHDVYAHLDAATADQFGLILEGWLRSTVGGSNGGESIAGLLPSPIPPMLNPSVEQPVIDLIKSNTSLVSTYKQASTIAHVPWELLAGLHNREGGSNPNSSLVSGRTIGTDEPDVDAGGGCAHNSGQPGQPILLASGGCGFKSLLDSAIYAGNLLKGKVGGIMSTFDSMVSATSHYNGGGNRDDPSGERFYGDSDPYSMNFFDTASFDNNKYTHSQLYILYHCNNDCVNPIADTRPGVVTIAKDVYLNIK